MADSLSLALIDALKGKQQRDLASNPWISAGNAITKTSLYDAESSPWENLAVAALQGLGGGMMQGYGIGSAENENADLTARLTNALKEEDPTAAMMQQQDLKQFAPIYSLDQQQRAREVQDQQTQFGQDIVKQGTLAGYQRTNQLEFNEQQHRLDAPEKRENDLVTLRKEFQGLPEIQAYVKSDIGYRSLQNAIKDPKSTSDLELVRGAIQAIEPGMAVREGEQAAVAGSGSIPETWKAQLDKALRGESGLSPTVRQGILEIAERRFNEYRAQAEMAQRFYQNEANRRGFDPNSVSYLNPGGPKPIPKALPGESLEQFKARVRSGG